MISLLDWLGPNKEEYLNNCKICNQRWDDISDYKTIEEIKALPPELWINGAFEYSRQKEMYWVELSLKWRDVVKVNEVVFEDDTIYFLNWLGDRRKKYLKNCMIENQRWLTKDRYKDLDEIKELHPRYWVAEAFNWDYSEECWEDVSSSWRRITERCKVSFE